MAKSNRVVLYSPTGDRYEAADRSEITRLKARGYTDKAPAGPGDRKPVDKKP